MAFKLEIGFEEAQVYAILAHALHNAWQLRHFITKKTFFLFIIIIIIEVTPLLSPRKHLVHHIAGCRPSSSSNLNPQCHVSVQLPQGRISRIKGFQFSINRSPYLQNFLEFFIAYAHNCEHCSSICLRDGFQHKGQFVLEFSRYSAYSY